MDEYSAEVSEWLTDHYGHQYREGAPRPYPQPGPAFYEDMYRRARVGLRTVRSKNLRKHFQRQLWTARACLKSYFGMEPPPA